MKGGTLPQAPHPVKATQRADSQFFSELCAIPRPFPAGDLTDSWPSRRAPHPSFVGLDNPHPDRYPKVDPCRKGPKYHGRRGCCFQTTAKCNV